MHECQICKNYARRTLAEILRHIREVHPHFEGKVKCNVNSCPSTLSTYESLRHHMYKNHKDVLKDDSANAEDISSDDMAAELDVFADSSTEVVSNVQSNLHYDDDDDDDDDDILHDEAAKYILKIQEGKKLTQTVTEGIIRDTTSIIHHTVDHLKKKVHEQLKETIDEAQLDEIEQIFMSPTIRNPFQQLETRYQQDKFFQEHFNYIVSITAHTCTHARVRMRTHYVYSHKYIISLLYFVQPPTERVLGRKYKRTLSGTITEARDCCYDVPLLDSLQCLLKCKSIVQQVLASYMYFIYVKLRTGFQFTST